MNICQLSLFLIYIDDSLHLYSLPTYLPFYSTNSLLYSIISSCKNPLTVLHIDDSSAKGNPNNVLLEIFLIQSSLWSVWTQSSQSNPQTSRRGPSFETNGLTRTHNNVKTEARRIDHTMTMVGVRSCLPINPLRNG